jgi:flagella basal body P-ring formation protein FlgA
MHRLIIILLYSWVFVGYFSLETPALSKNSLKNGIITKATQKILTNYDYLSKKDIKIKIANQNALEIPPNVDSYELVIQQFSNILGETILPLVFFDKNKKRVHKAHIKLKITAYTNFLRATETIYKHAKLTSANIKATYESLYAKPANHVSSLKQSLGKEAKTFIPKKSLILKRMIRDVPNIRQGDKITILVSDKNLALKVKGHALEDGVIGDSIKVRTSLKNKKTLIGEIIATKLVKVCI